MSIMRVTTVAVRTAMVNNKSSAHRKASMSKSMLMSMKKAKKPRKNKKSTKVLLNLFPRKKTCVLAILAALVSTPTIFTNSMERKMMVKNALAKKKKRRRKVAWRAKKKGSHF